MAIKRYGGILAAEDQNLLEIARRNAEPVPVEEPEDNEEEAEEANCDEVNQSYTVDDDIVSNSRYGVLNIDDNGGESCSNVEKRRSRGKKQKKITDYNQKGGEWPRVQDVYKPKPKPLPTNTNKKRPMTQDSPSKSREDPPKRSKRSFPESTDSDSILVDERDIPGPSNNGEGTLDEGRDKSVSLGKRRRDSLDDDEIVEGRESKRPREKLGFKVEFDQEVESKRFHAKERWYNITFDSERRGSVTDILSDLEQILQEILDQTLDGIRDRDHVRFVLISPELVEPIAIPWVLAKDMSVEEMLKAIENVLQSNHQFYLHGGVKLVIKHVSIPVGGRSRSVRTLDSHEFVKQSKCMIAIDNVDDLCFSRAVVVSMARPIPGLKKAHEKFGTMRSDREGKRSTLLETMAKDLHKKAGVPEGQVSANDFMKFQNAILPDYRLVVYGLRSQDGVIFEGIPAKYSVYLFYHQNHYDVISSPKAFVNSCYFCEACLKGYNNKKTHTKCTMGNSDTPICSQCRTHECNARVEDGDKRDWLKCDECLRSFKTQLCYDLHLKIKTCENYYICQYCKLFVHKDRLPVDNKGERSKHDCSDYHCQTCNNYVTKDHNCCMVPEDYPEYKNVMPYIFFDYECTQETGVHIPNLVVAKWTCTDCLDLEAKLKREGRSQSFIDSYDEINNCKLCGPIAKREEVFEPNGYVDVNKSFCHWLFNTKKHNGATVIAHNNSGYDIHFIIQYMISNGIKPSNIIRTGGKIRQMIEPMTQIRFIDSLSFLPMALSKLPKCFGFTELKKGYFPHFFNKKANINHNGFLPSMDDYGVKSMMPSARVEFEKWYAEMLELEEKGLYKFNMRKEILEYCRSDVDILMKACSEFRRLFMEITMIDDERTGIDPFRKSSTLASACNLVYRTLFMPGEKIALIPPKGYSPKKNQSVKGLRWLHTQRVLKGMEIQDAMHGGEHYINGVGFVDGYGIDPETNRPTVFSHFGCFYHGCSVCFGHSTRNPVTGKTMGQLYQETLERCNKLKDLGYELVEMWEHKFDTLMKTDPQFKEIALQCNVQPPLQPRDAFFGGRTNAVKLFYDCKEGEQIKYYDVTSLYPFTQKYKRFGIGQPTVIRENFGKIEDYFGLIKCKILPPTSLYLPLLPVKAGGKLVFPLCAKCAENNQTDLCRHTDDERVLEGTWVSVEIMKAIELGYKVTEIIEVWHFEKTSQYDPSTGEKGIFSEYIDTFLKIKQECSGWPEGVESQEEKDKYIDDYLKAEGIKLDPDKIKHNPGLRAVSKLCLNTLWGRFGMRDNLPKTEFINAPARLFELLECDEIELMDLNFYGDMFAEITYKYGDNFINTNSTTNVIIAAFTTAYARLKLYEMLEPLGHRALYFDTDSCIFVQKEGEWNPPLGSNLGELTDEVGGGRYIKTFVSGGPKSYAYQLNDGDTVCKIRGITLHSEAIKVINFDTLKQMVKGEGPERVTVHDSHKIVRDLKNKQILSKPQSKDYRVVYNKRVRVGDFDTVPHGYRPVN